MFDELDIEYKICLLQDNYSSICEVFVVIVSMTSRLVTADVDVLDWALFVLVSGSPDVSEANTRVETVEEHEWKGEMHNNLPGCHPEKPVHNLHANVLLPEGSEYPKADVDDDEESDDATSGLLAALLRLVRVHLHSEDDDRSRAWLGAC